MSALEPLLERLAKLHPKLIDLSLTRIERLLGKLGDPHKHLPPVIHVAGTNGKGSTSAFMRALLEAKGKRAHVYTSPHLVHFRERYRLGAEGSGKLVSDEALAAVLAEIEQVNAGEPITQFEITTVAGFLLFARHPADAVILEVGLGGRFDATNVIARPAVSVITPIGFDHMDYLGHTLSAIAGEKAQIIKRGRPVVSAAQEPEALAVIEAVADERRARLTLLGLDVFYREEHGRFIYQDEDGLYDLPLPSLAGGHQLGNAALAMAGVKAAGFAVDAESAETAMRQVRWPARMQTITEGPLTHLIPKGAELLLDGGHNAHGGAALASAVKALRPRPLIMICGMINTKDPGAFLTHFAGLAERLIAVPFDYPAALPPQTLVDAAKGVGLKAETAPSLSEALSRVEQSDVPPRILLCGSLYFAGDVLRQNDATLD